jgi:hypothetical protein
MKTEIKIILFCLLALMLGGCIPMDISLHPLYTDETLIYDETLIGKWIGGDEIWQFSKAGEKEYELRIVKSEKEGRFEAHLLELEGKMYLDLYPGKNESLENLNDYYIMHLMRVHTFFRIDQTEPNLQLRWVYVGKLLENDPNLLRHEKVNKDQIVLTASTEELQKFIIEHANDVVDVNDKGSELIRMEELFHEDDIIFEEKLLGKWESKDGEQIISKNNGQDIGYDIIYKEKDETERRFKAIAVRIKDMNLLAVYYSEPTDNEIECGQELIPDMFVAVEQIEPMLLVHPIDYRQVQKMIKNGSESLEDEDTGCECYFEGRRIESH